MDAMVNSTTPIHDSHDDGESLGAETTAEDAVSVSVATSARIQNKEIAFASGVLDDN